MTLTRRTFLTATAATAAGAVVVGVPGTTLRGPGRRPHGVR